MTPRRMPAIRSDGGKVDPSRLPVEVRPRPLDQVRVRLEPADEEVTARAEETPDIDEPVSLRRRNVDVVDIEAFPGRTFPTERADAALALKPSFVRDRPA